MPAMNSNYEDDQFVASCYDALALKFIGYLCKNTSFSCIIDPEDEEDHAIEYVYEVFFGGDEEDKEKIERKSLNKEADDSSDEQNLICKKKKKLTKTENKNNKKKKNQKTSLLLKKKKKEETKEDESIEKDAENKEEESESEENEDQGMFGCSLSKDKKMTENIILKAEGGEEPFEGKGKDFFDLYGKTFDHDKLQQGQRNLFDMFHNMIPKNKYYK